jgi:2,3-bisphosphoglycerate-dependent phosphoglycerate mutase
MMIEVVFETHSLSEDNERGRASGWAGSRLSERGRVLAGELGERRRGDGIAAVFCSDLRRAVETVEVAFEGSRVPVLLDWRLRECDFGERNGSAVEAHLRDRPAFLDVPYPGGESWRQAVARCGCFLKDLPLRWRHQRVLIVGHVATRWALDHYVGGVGLEMLISSDFGWQEGWQYALPNDIDDYKLYQ